MPMPDVFDGINVFVIPDGLRGANVDSQIGAGNRKEGCAQNGVNSYDDDRESEQKKYNFSVFVVNLIPLHGLFCVQGLKSVKLLIVA